MQESYCIGCVGCVSRMFASRDFSPSRSLRIPTAPPDPSILLAASYALLGFWNMQCVESPWSRGPWKCLSRVRFFDQEVSDGR